jgi:hypothetical protein
LIASLDKTDQSLENAILNWMESFSLAESLSSIHAPKRWTTPGSEHLRSISDLFETQKKQPVEPNTIHLHSTMVLLKRKKGRRSTAKL